MPAKSTRPTLCCAQDSMEIAARLCRLRSRCRLLCCCCCCCCLLTAAEEVGSQQVWRARRLPELHAGLAEVSEVLSSLGVGHKLQRPLDADVCVSILVDKAYIPQLVLQLYGPECARNTRRLGGEPCKAAYCCACSSVLATRAADHVLHVQGRLCCRQQPSKPWAIVSSLCRSSSCPKASGPARLICR